MMHDPQPPKPPEKPETNKTTPTRNVYDMMLAMSPLAGLAYQR